MDVIIMDMGDGVKGDSSLPGYKGKIELLSFNSGDGGQSTGHISVSERASGWAESQGFIVTKYIDAASPALQRAWMEGKRFPQVSVVAGRHERGEIQELMRYTLSGVMISNYSASGGVGDHQLETWALSYDKITWDLHPRGTQGE